MAIVLWQAVMSLDGFIAGSDDAMDWVFDFGGPTEFGGDPPPSAIICSTGSVLAGRRSYYVGRKPGRRPEARKVRPTSPDPGRGPRARNENSPFPNRAQLEAAGAKVEAPLPESRPTLERLENSAIRRPMVPSVTTLLGHADIIRELIDGATGYRKVGE
jgi:hypothetical protein